MERGLKKLCAIGFGACSIWRDDRIDLVKISRTSVGSRVNVQSLTLQCLPSFLHPTIRTESCAQGVQEHTVPDYALPSP